MAATSTKAETRKLLCKYSSASPLTAYAAIVDSKNKHLIGKRVDELGFRSNHNAILLLIDIPGDAALKRKRVLEKSPKKDSIIEDGAWLYFGLPTSDNTEDAVVSLKRALFPSMSSQTVGRSVNAKAGLIAFTLEFDCFQFPDHLGGPAVLGTHPEADQIALDLRETFDINLAGILPAERQEPVGQRAHQGALRVQDPLQALVQPHTSARNGTDCRARNGALLRHRRGRLHLP